jgi:hypothetical protein
MKAIGSCLVALVLALGAAGCGRRRRRRRQGQGSGSAVRRDAIVVVVNPVVNTGSTTPVPNTAGSDRAAIGLDAEPGGAGTTDSTGLAVVNEGLSAGALSLIFGQGSSLPFTIVSDGDVYDLAVAYDGNGVQAFDNFPIRFPPLPAPPDGVSSSSSSPQPARPPMLAKAKQNPRARRCRMFRRI